MIIRDRSTKLFVGHVLILPIATLVAFVVYLQHPQVNPSTSLYAPLPMVASLWVTHIVCSLFLVYHPIQFTESHLSVVLVALAISLAASVLIIFLSRVHYSLGFLLTFFLVVWPWATWQHRKMVHHYKNLDFGIAKTGGWQTVKQFDIDHIDFIDEPARFDTTRHAALVIDDSAPVSDSWTELISKALGSGTEVISLARFFELYSGRVLLETWTSPSLDQKGPNSLYLVLKRLVDIVVSGTLLVGTFPLIILCLIAIRLGSPGNPLYIQTRIGRYGKHFRLYKLRTMRLGAESDGPRFASSQDPRVTWFGTFLRRTKMDEWPQFLNVLRGDMSLVGPRPERPEWIEQFRKELPYYELRHAVCPGITGWAQITDGYASNIDETRRKLERDLFYIRHMNLSLDIAILFRTIPVLGKGFTLGDFR
jgi:UDP-GalNAc:undecaprenyl-phosphate GalNAc-1-phosphate transferase